MFKSSHSPHHHLKLIQTITSYTTLTGHFAPNRQVQKAPRSRQFDRQLFMSDGKCHQRVVARAVSTLNQPTQPRSSTGAVNLFTTTLIDAAEAEVPSPRRRRERGWCEPAETSPTFKVAWATR